MADRPTVPSATALRAAAALRALGTEYKRWVTSRTPDGTEITSARLQALAVLTERGPITMVALSRQLGTTAHNVTKLVDWLETAGLVERRKDADDRRMVRLHVTGRGREIANRHVHEHEESVAEPFTDLTSQELNELTRLLDKLRTAIGARLA